MIEKIVTLENNEKYLMILNELIDNKNFYFGVKLEGEKYSNEFKLFLEKRKDSQTYLEKIEDEELIKVLLNNYILDNI